MPDAVKRENDVFLAHNTFELGTALATIAVLFLSGQLAVLLYCRTMTGFAMGLAASIMGVLTGILIGFLFGIPRVIRGANTVVDTTEPQLATSSSLEEVADWFVKLLLGAGLAQLSTIAGHVTHLAKMLQEGFVVDGAVACSEFPCFMPGSLAVSMAIVVSHPIIGFVLGYLWTKARLISVFREAEERARKTRVRDEKTRRFVDASQAAVGGAAVMDDARLQSAKELMRINPKDLNPEGRIAWARLAVELAKQPNATRDDVERAKQAREILDAALRDDPSLASSKLAAETSRQVEATDFLTPLYEKGGYQKLLDKYPPASRASLTGTQVGYLVAALGQKHTQTKDAAQQKEIAAEAYALMLEAIKKEPSLENWFEFLLRQDDKSIDNDLTTLREVPEFKAWLDQRTSGARR